MLLKDESHFGSQFPQFRRRQACQVFAEQTSLTAIDGCQPDTTAEQGRLAGAIGSYERNRLALKDLKADVPEDWRIAIEALAQLANRKLGAPHFCELGGRDIGSLR
jgi:hypothetical protein